MFSKTVRARLEAALAARGEVKQISASPTARWSRAYLGKRGADGQLVPNVSGKPFWFVGSGGSLRVGFSRGNTSAVKEPILKALLEEGDAIARQQSSTDDPALSAEAPTT
jgi:hypothetical protein